MHGTKFKIARMHDIKVNTIEFRVILMTKS